MLIPDTQITYFRSFLVYRISCAIYYLVIILVDLQDRNNW